MFIINIMNNSRNYINQRFINNVSRIAIYINKSAIYENENELGLSHLLEHIIMSNTKNKHYDSLQSKGIKFNATTNPNYVVFYIYGLDKYYDIMYSFLINVVKNPLIENDIIENSKKHIKQELLGFYNKNTEGMYNAIYNYFGSYNNDIGLKNINNWDIQLDKLNSYTKNDIITFYKKHYVSRNMLISVVKNGFYSYNSMNKLFEPSFKIFKVPLSKNIEIQNPNIKKTNICIVYTCDISKKLNYLLYTDIVQQMFTAGINSILMSYLRQKLNLIYYINLTYFKVQNLFLSVFEFSTESASANKVIESFFHCINNYRQIKNINEIIKGSKEKIILDYIENNLKDKTSFIENFYSSQILNGCSKSQIIHKKDIINLLNKITDKEIFEIINYLFNKNSIVVCKQVKK